MNRFTVNKRCPICNGYEGAERGEGKRCYGFASPSGEYVNCTREDYAGLLELNDSSKAYVHRMVGDCNCGKRHDPNPAKKIVATYDYTDEAGNLLYQVVRYEPKGFAQRVPDGNDWSWKLGNIRRVPYNLPDILAQPDKPVFIVEGEKDADVLNSHGLLATTNAGGAGKWRDEYSAALRGRDVVVIPDHDEAGLDHLNKVVRSLTGNAKSVKVVMPGEEKDISKWFESGGTVNELDQMVRAVAETTLDNIPLSTTESADERLLLGTVLLTPDILPHLAVELKPWHLLNDTHRKIYKAMLAIDERGEVVDIPTLFNELQSNPSLQGSGVTREQIVALTVNVPALQQYTIQQSITRVREAAHLRYMRKLNEEVTRRIDSGQHSAKDIYEFQNTSLDKLSVVTGVSQDFVSFEQMADGMQQLYTDLHEGKVTAVSTGFKELDNILSWGGLLPKSTSILAAHTSFGKTSLALDLAKRIAQQGFSVAIFSLEMDKESLFMKVHSNISRLESHKIRPGMSSTERDILLRTIKDIASLPIYINDRITDVIQMRSAIRTFVRTHKNVGVIIVDYLQLAGIATLRNDAQERERISEISRLMKQIASEFGVAIIELSQFSRDSYKEEREPVLSDLYGSGSIEKDADNIWMLHGEKPDEVITIRELIFLFSKQRRGRIGRFGMKFDTARNRFVSYSLQDGSPDVTSVDMPVVQPRDIHAVPNEPARVIGADGEDLF